jgi:glutaredoxin
MPDDAGRVIAITIYSRPGCHLCDEMKALVDRVAPSIAGASSVTVVDVETDRDLESRYGLEVPVLLVNGKKAAKYRIDEKELRRVLAAHDDEGTA